MDSFQMIFLEAVSIGDTNKINEMLKYGMVDVKYKHKINGWNALHWAARRNFYDICCDLISYGFDLKEKTKEGKTAYEVLPKNASEKLKQLLFIEKVEENKEQMIVNKVECNYTPNYIKYPPFPHINNNKNEISNQNTNSSNIPESPVTQNTEKIFSYGRRGSDVRTRFLLVRTCCINGKEAFKRVTLPGGATVESLKLTIEKAMKLGSVIDVITLPDNIIIENDDQIKEFNDCQKVEVVFDTISKKESKQDNNLSNKDSTIKKNSLLHSNTKDIKIRDKDKYSYIENLGKNVCTKKMNEVKDNFKNDEQSFDIERLKEDDTNLNHDEEFGSDISLQDITGNEEKKMSYVTVDNGFIQEIPSAESPVFDIITSDAIFEDNNSQDTSIIKKVSTKKSNTNLTNSSNDVDHGLRHVASIPRHQFKAEHVEDHVSPKISLEKKEQEDKEHQQFLVTITAAAAVALGSLCVFGYLLK
uniref:ANK_REP_REGION domain-containing protein n=1 Tax=Strongyloides stercoralis TaxID=6248 RepID=A0A0K0DY34_STRER